MYTISIPTTTDPHENAATIVKKKPGQAGQAGHDGTSDLRTRRVETRVSPHEHATICSYANSQGFNSIAQYIRQQALYASSNSPFSKHNILLACQAELNDIASHVNQIACHLTKGEPLDDEILMVMMQILDLAEENLKRIIKESLSTTTEAM